MQSEDANRGYKGRSTYEEGVGSKEVVYQQGLLLIKGIDRATHPAIKFH